MKITAQQLRKIIQETVQSSGDGILDACTNVGVGMKDLTIAMDSYRASSGYAGQRAAAFAMSEELTRLKRDLAELESQIGEEWGF